MAKFTDRLGREWAPSLTVGHLKPLKEVGVQADTLAAAGPKLHEYLFEDPQRLVAALYVLCEEQAKAANVSPEQFGYGFDGPTLGAGGEAFLEAVIDFFPRSRIAQNMRGRVREALAEMDEAVIRKAELSGSAGSSPAPPASTPPA